MEEIIQLILGLLWEVLGEFILQIVCELLAEVGLRWLTGLFWGDDLGARKARPVAMFLGCAVLGGLVGILSLSLRPQHFIRTGMFRGLNLIVTPLIAGGTMAALGSWRNKRGQRVIGLDKFFNGWVFALAFAIVRLVGCR